MRINKKYMISICFMFLPLMVSAQPVTISAEQVLDLMKGKNPALLVDVRTVEEYRSGHIPGAISIPADRIVADRAKLPGDLNAPIIFYCRGVG